MPSKEMLYWSEFRIQSRDELDHDQTPLCNSHMPTKKRIQLGAGNSSYSAGRDQEDHSLQPGPGQMKKTHHKKRLRERFTCLARVRS
jgi:hypothetical protein